MQSDKHTLYMCEARFRLANERKCSLGVVDGPKKNGWKPKIENEKIRKQTNSRPMTEVSLWVKLCASERLPNFCH